MNTATSEIRESLLRRAEARGWVAVGCSGNVVGGEARWRTTVARAFPAELEQLADQLAALEARALPPREAEPRTAELLQSPAEYAEVVRERERRQQHAEAEFARRERQLKSKQLDDAGIE